MKLYSFSILYLISLFVLTVSAGIVSTSLEAFSHSYMNLLTEKNLKLNIKFGPTTETLDVYYDKKHTDVLKPVVIFVHGGGWIMGNKSEYSKIGSLLLKDDYVAVIPDYVLFPRGSIDDMVDNIYNAIQWTYENISEYGGDKENIILSGHSAGAHLSLLTTLKAKLGAKNNGKYLAPLPEFKKLVLFNGPFDFDDYDPIKFFKETDLDRGLAETLVRLLVKNEYVSPTDILRRYGNDSIEDLGAPTVTLFVADKDQLVPSSSNEHLSQQISRVSPSTNLNYVISEGKKFDHLSLVFGAMMDKHDKEEMFLDILRL